MIDGDGFFPVLNLHRDDVAAALAQHDPEAYAEAEAEDEPNARAVLFALALSDERMGELARAVGHNVMNGGEYYEATAIITLDWYTDDDPGTEEAA